MGDGEERFGVGDVSESWSIRGGEEVVVHHTCVAFDSLFAVWTMEDGVVDILY